MDNYMYRRRVLVLGVGSVLLLSTTPLARAQRLSEEQAIERAREGVSLAFGVNAEQLPVYGTWFRPRDPEEAASRDRWVVDIGDYEVGSIDPTGAIRYISWSRGVNLDELRAVPSFRPWYRSSDEPVALLREIASRFGLNGLVAIQESSIPPLAQDGTVSSRYCYVKLVPRPNGVECAGSPGNYASVSMDAQSGAMHLLSMETSHEYEAFPPRYVGEQVARRAAVAGGDIGDIERVVGPTYTAMAKPVRDCAAAGLAYCSSGVVPVVYTVVGSRQVVYVHAGTGELLAKLGLDVDKSVAKVPERGSDGKGTNRVGGLLSKSSEFRGTAKVPPDSAWPPVGLAVSGLAGIAAVGGLAWWLNRRRGLSK